MDDTQLITLEHLQQVGVELEGKDTEALLTEVNDKLNERIGEEVALSLSDEQLDEMVKLQEKDDDEALDEWMSKNVPELEQIAEDERDIMLGDLAEKAETLTQ